MFKAVLGTWISGLEGHNRKSRNNGVMGLKNVIIYQVCPTRFINLLGHMGLKDVFIYHGGGAKAVQRGLTSTKGIRDTYPLQVFLWPRQAKKWPKLFPRPPK